MPEDDSCSGQLENDGDWLPMDSEEDGASLSFRAIHAAHSYYVSLSSGSTPDEGPDLQEFIEGICQELETDPVQEESLIKRFRKKNMNLAFRRSGRSADNIEDKYRFSRQDSLRR